MAITRKIIPAMLVALLLSAPAAAADDAQITVDRPWARASILKSRPGAAYLTIRNNGTTPDRLIGATSPLAESVMIHATKSSGGAMRMRAVPGLEIGAGERVALQPGGTHLMLMGLREKLVQGGNLPLVLTFERAGAVELRVPILSIAAKGPPER